MKTNQKRIQLDWSKMLGFKLVGAEQRSQAVIGAKLGAKLGAKVGSKAGFKFA